MKLFKIILPLLLLFILYIIDTQATGKNIPYVANITPFLIAIFSLIVAIRVYKIATLRGKKLKRILLFVSTISFCLSIILLSILGDTENLLVNITGYLAMTVAIIGFFVVVVFVVAFIAGNFRKIIKLSLNLFNIRTIAIVNLIALITGGIYLNNYFKQFEKRIGNIENKFGGSEKVVCPEGETKKELSKNVFRIIGGHGEGSGFPVSSEYIITSFHVIEGEPSPKVVFPDGTIETPKDIKAIKHKDFAILTVNKKLSPPKLFSFDNTKSFDGLMIGEPLYAFGYPLGSTIKGDPAMIKGSFAGNRWLAQVNMNVIETSISLVNGMSGGPLVDSCGKVVGVNTLGVGGFSMFLNITDVIGATSDMTDEPIAKIEIDTSTPEGVVKAFYTYIKARNLQEAFNLISEERKSTVSSFEEWTKGYANTLHVNLIKTAVDEDDENKVKIKIESQDWVNEEMAYKYFEGIWEIIKEDSGLKLNKSNIKQVENPPFWWFYYWEKPDYWKD